jgi:hypothetical protein
MVLAMISDRAKKANAISDRTGVLVCGQSWSQSKFGLDECFQIFWLAADSNWSAVCGWETLL